MSSNDKADLATERNRTRKSNNWLDQWQSGRLATKVAFSPFRAFSRRQLAFPFCFSHSGVRLQGWQTSGLLLLSKKKLRFYNALDKKERFRRFTYIIRRIRIEKLNRWIFAKHKPIYCHHEWTSCYVAPHVPWVPETFQARFPRPTAEDVSAFGQHRKFPPHARKTLVPREPRMREI